MTGRRAELWVDARRRPPRPPDDVVSRAVVRSRLDAAAGAVAVVAAPGGYGKTSQVALWAADEKRPTGWLSLLPADDDPARLLEALVGVLQSVTDIDAVPLQRSWAPTDLPARAAPLLGELVAATTEPFVLVLDDVHLIGSPIGWELLGHLAERVPSGATLVLVGRSRPELPIGRLRIRPGVVEIGATELALSESETDDLLRDLGVDLLPDQVLSLRQTTEGWPVGLRLAALLCAESTDTAAALEAFRGSDRLVADYLRHEWLRSLDDDQRRFLLDVSCFEWFSAEMCDEVLDRTDSADTIDRLQSSGCLVVPLDRRSEWYRLHHLLADFLRAEARRREPARRRQMHLRASTWFEGCDQNDAAVQHALDAGDRARARDLIVRHSGRMLTQGHHATVLRWLTAIGLDDATGPALGVLAASAHFGLGDVSGALLWLRRVPSAQAASADPSIQDAVLRAAGMRAGLGTEPFPELLAEAHLAYDGLPPGPYHAFAAFVLSGLFAATGDQRAVPVAVSGEAEAAIVGAHTMEANCASVRAVVALGEGDWSEGRDAAHRACRIIREHQLQLVPTTLLGAAAYAWVEAADGHMDQARTAWTVARDGLTKLDGVAPWFNALVRIALARASLLFGDPVTASSLVRESQRYLDVHPELTWAVEQLRQIRDMATTSRHPVNLGATRLTAAQMRVLRYLPTNLGLGDIADRIYVSRNTVKSHAISIYRALGVNNRTEAVEAARRMGLLDPGGGDLRV